MDLYSVKTDRRKMSPEEKVLYRDYREDLDAHNDVINSVPFDALEAMEGAKVFDEQSAKTENGLTDSMTATIYEERAARVVGQLPTGQVKAFGRRDRGKGLFMSLILSNWIFSNANAQRPLKDKLYLWKQKASVYNWVPMYADINMEGDYFGPDCWLWNPRNFIPQSGQTSVADMDYCHALAYKSPKWFENLLEDDDEKDYDKEVLREIIDVIKNKTRDRDTERETAAAREEKKQSVRQVCVATRYEAGKKGKWVTFLPDFNCQVIRDIENPHKNSRIPFVVLHGRPDAFSWQGTGDYQRSLPMQAASDGATNFYFETVRRNLAPATYVNAQSLILHTWSDEPNALIQFNGPPEAKQADTSTAGLSSYQSVKGELKGALQSIAGTTDTRVNSENAMDPGFAKTPQGLKMIEAREDTRDAQDRSFFEEALKELVDLWLSMVPTVAKKIPVDLFHDEITEIVKTGGEDLLEMLHHGQELTQQVETADGMEEQPLLDETGKPQKYISPIVESGLATFRESESGEQAKFKIDPEKLRGLNYRFELEPNSTQKKTKEEQLKALMEYLSFLGQMPNALQQLQQASGKVLNWEKINEIYGSLSDIPGMDEMFTESETPAPSASPEAEDMQNVAPETPSEAPPEAPAPPPGAPPPEALTPPPEPTLTNPLTGQPYDPEIGMKVRELLARQQQTREEQNVAPVAP